MTLTLANATLASLWPRRLTTGSVTIDHGRIMTMGDGGPRDALGAHETIDLHGRLVMPGNVCAHTHLYSALARGMPAPAVAPTNFPEILAYIWWRLDRALDLRGVRSSGLAGLLDAARAGTTTLIDHHASPNAIDGSLDVLAGAVDEIGLRGVLCYEVTDRNGIEGRDAGLRENERFLAAQRECVRGMVGGHASFTLSDDSLDLLSAMAEAHGTGVHIHVAEDVADEEDAMRRAHRRVVERLDAHGILRPQSILAHCIHLDERELRIARKRQPWMVHNCRSNMNNHVGRARPLEWDRRSALGTDGIDGDMFAESRTAFFRARDDDLTASADQFSDLLAHGGSLATEIFQFPIGTLEVGAAADLIILNYDPPTPLTAENLAWHWMFALSAANVDSVMVDGKWILRHGEFVGVDEEKIRAEAREEAKRVWQTMADLPDERS